MNFQDLLDVLETANDEGINETRKKSKRFDALCSIDECLRYVAKNRIEPNTKDGKHIYLELEEILATFNKEFIKMGVNPNLSVNWQLNEAEKE